MWLKEVTTISMAVFGALLIGVVALPSDWGRNAQVEVESAAVSASRIDIDTLTSADDNPIHITLAVPPYIILNGLLQDLITLYATSNHSSHLTQQPQTRISITSMPRSDPEYTASSSIAQKTPPDVFVYSQSPGSFGRSRLGLSASE